MNLKTQAAELTRRKILDTCIQILGTEGFTALTVGKLSKQAGISKGALYHHFASLHEVLLAVLTDLIETYGAHQELQGCETLAAFFQSTGDNLFNLLENHPTIARAMQAFMSQAVFDNQAQAPILALWQDNLERYQVIVAQLAPAIPQATLTEVIYMMDTFICGTLGQWFVCNNDQMLRASWQRFSSMMIVSLNSAKTIPGNE
ncbi:TetR/AcrR family transcriptional regulator [Ferrimonas pelagia]|uniref:HTH tetR-type domain-containing protein n=1 Tax=Ferrimonas pelagia TaxID=1177826 RepID=A0ABP9EH79_9GAMM